jgi:hypothetical protein
MIDFLRAKGTQRMIAYVLRENDGMRELAADAGFVVDRAGSDSDALRLVKTLAPPAT